MYGAFNFWKTRDIEVVQQAADYHARRRPIVAAPKIVIPPPSPFSLFPLLSSSSFFLFCLQAKPTDEALLQKPPIQAVRLRFLQKSKSVESIQMKPTVTESAERRKERLTAIHEEYDREEGKRRAK